MLQDGKDKNDHELCAAVRLLPFVKQALGAQKAIIGGDGLFANAPFIRTVSDVIIFDFITDIPLCIENIVEIVKIGRARWKIENETFNTLKNQGYQYAHNFGHGKKFLSQNFAQLMLLAFMFDQVQQILDPLFQKALTICKTKKLVWIRLRQIFDLVPCISMEHIYKIITTQIKLNIQMIV